MAIDFDKFAFKREGEEDSYIGRSCYIFNKTLDRDMDDTACDHCAKFMTLRCDHIEEFIDE